jgi:hypothetical protein
MKRIAVCAIAVLSLVLSTGSALADDGGGGTVVTSPIEPPWVLAHPNAGGACPNLPSTGDAAKITMLTGTQTSITKIRTNRHGITTIRNFTHSFGTATDQGGHVYAWDYKNRFRVSNTAANHDVFSGLMVDTFSLGGGDDGDENEDDQGGRLLSNGFRAVFTTDFASFATFDPLSSFGDPISFPTGVPAHCDPL